MFESELQLLVTPVIYRSLHFTEYCHKIMLYCVDLCTTCNLISLVGILHLFLFHFPNEHDFIRYLQIEDNERLTDLANFISSMFKTSHQHFEVGMS